MRSDISDLFDMARIMVDDEFGYAHLINKTVRRISGRESVQSRSKEYYDLYKRSLLFDASCEFESFLLYIDIDKEPLRRFYFPRRKALKPIVDAFQDVFDGNYDLVTVSQPKRTGKTTVGLLGVLFLSGRNPHKSALCCGAGNDLVLSFYEGCLDILKNEQYGYYDIFPKAVLEHTNADSKIINLETRKRFATVTCRSIDGALTGSTEATNLLYLDDLVKNDEEAKNRDRLDYLWDKVRSDLLGRRLEGCPIIAQGTRYSIYDPIGRLQDIAPDVGWKTKIIEIPALNDKDESNFEMTNESGKKIFTSEYFKNERMVVSDEQWESQFQQQPFEAKGMLFPVDSLRRYFDLPSDKDQDAIVAVCDTAESGKDSVCMPVAYIYGEDVYIEDVVFNNATAEHTKPQCASMIVFHKVVMGEFESNSAGEYYARDVDVLVKEKGHKCSIRTKRTITNKQTRIEMAADNILKHFLFKDKSKYSINSEYFQYMKELTGYTRTGKVKHDDAPDGTALLENFVRNMVTQRVRVFERPF